MKHQWDIPYASDNIVQRWFDLHITHELTMWHKNVEKEIEGRQTEHPLPRLTKELIIVGPGILQGKTENCRGENPLDQLEALQKRLTTWLHEPLIYALDIETANCLKNFGIIPEIILINKKVEKVPKEFPVLYHLNRVYSLDELEYYYHFLSLPDSTFPDLGIPILQTRMNPLTTALELCFANVEHIYIFEPFMNKATKIDSPKEGVINVKVNNTVYLLPLESVIHNTTFRWWYKNFMVKFGIFLRKKGKKIVFCTQKDYFAFIGLGIKQEVLKEYYLEEA